MPLQFRKQDRDRVASGEITLTYRLWKSPHVKAGRVYPTGFGEALVESVDLMPAALIDEDDLALTGFRSMEEVWASAGDHTKSSVGPDTLLYRVKFSMLPRKTQEDTPREDEPVALTKEQVEALSMKLSRMDARSPTGPWTWQILRLIGEHPGLVSTRLAEMMGRERFGLKADIRKLKALGLTHSLLVGYELSPLGRALLEAHEG